MIEVMGVLMGVDMQAFAGGRDEAMPPMSPPESPSTSYTPTTPSASTSKPSAPTPDVKMAEPESESDEEPDEEAQAKAEALKEKEAGNAAYKKRDFADAESHFTKAWDLWPKDITFLTNLAGEFESFVR